jgi:hypothetical protein
VNILKLKYKFTLILLLSACLQASGQHCKFYTVNFKDSLVGTKDQKILMNNIVIENPNNKTMRLGYTVTIPSCWKPLSGGKNLVINQNLILSPLEKRVIPINLLKLPSAVAQWDSVQIIVWMQAIADTHTYYYHLNVEPQYSYVVGSYTNAINIETEKTTQALVSVYIRNSGNITDDFKLFWENTHLNINDSVKIRLKPGQDSTVFHAVKFKSWKLKDIQNERLTLTINNSKDEVRNLYCDINNPQSILVENKSAYKTLPLYIEGGTMTMGDGVAYYGAIRGQITLGQEHFVDFSYRSNQMGNFINQFQPNVFNIRYHNKSFDISAGQLSGPSGFYVFGNGLNVTYKNKRGNEFSVTGIKHIKLPYNTVANSDNISAKAIYSLGKLKFTDQYIVNSDVKYHLNSYLLTKSIDIVNKNGFLVSVSGGAGIDEKTKEVPGNVNKYSNGFAGGYIFNLTKTHWSTKSMISYYSPDYPGMFRGAHIESHDLQWLTKHTGIGGFYTSNAMEANYLRDTLYNSDYLSYNITKYGVMFNLFNKGKSSNLNLRVGKLTQKGQQGMYTSDEMYSVDMLYNMQYRRININAFSQNAFVKDVLLSNNSLMVSVGNFGINGSYNRTPGFSDGKPVTTESVNGGPNVSFNLFRKTLNANVRYNVSKLLGDDSYTTGIGGNLSYNNRKLGLQVMTNVFYSFTKSDNPLLPAMYSRFGTLSISKSLNVPIPKSKKYYDLKVVLFKDVNSDGQKDDGEEVLENAMVYVQDFNLVTNRRGEIDCKNLPSGNYTINLINTRKAKLIATNGPIQTIALNQDTKVYIPFKEGRTLTGKVNIELDSLSLAKFSAEFLKIVISDSSGHIYSALSDADGQFSIALPDGAYKVSLNPALIGMEGFKPEEMSYNVDLTTKESGFVQFTIKQKKRKIKVLEPNKI